MTRPTQEPPRGALLYPGVSAIHWQRRTSEASSRFDWVWTATLGVTGLIVLALTRS